MPTFRQTIWEDVEPGMTVLGRDGQPRLITSNHYDWNNDSYVIINGMWRLESHKGCVVVETTELEAVLAIVKAFPGTEIIES